jgi:hypothetical protein
MLPDLPAERPGKVKKEMIWTETISFITGFINIRIACGKKRLPFNQVHKITRDQQQSDYPGEPANNNSQRKKLIIFADC